MQSFVKHYQLLFSVINTVFGIIDYVNGLAVDLDPDRRRDETKNPRDKQMKALKGIFSEQTSTLESLQGEFLQNKNSINGSLYNSYTSTINASFQSLIHQLGNMFSIGDFDIMRKSYLARISGEYYAAQSEIQKRYMQAYDKDKNVINDLIRLNSS